MSYRFIAGNLLCHHLGCQLNDQPKAESVGPERPQPTHWPLRWWLAKRILGAAVLIAAGLFIAWGAHGLGVRYGFTNAHIVREQDVGSGSRHSGVRAEVRFRLANDTPVRDYIHLDHRLAAGKPIPIYYVKVAPRIAAYAGPNSSVSLFAVRVGYITAVLFFVAALVVLAFGIIRLYRTATFLRMSATGAAVQLRSYHVGNMVTATSQRDDKQFTWRVLPPDSPVDLLLRFLRLFRMAAAARPRPSPFEILASAKRKADATRPAFAKKSDAWASRELKTRRWIALRSADVLLVPMSRAQPVFGTGLVPPPPLTEFGALVRDHRRLLAAYGTVLDEAAQLPKLIRPPTDEGESVAGLRTVLCWRVVVRLWIESHIRRQLGQLANAYAQAHVLIAKVSSDADENRLSLTELREDCELLNSSLTDAPRRISSLVIGLATLITVITFIVKAPQRLPLVQAVRFGAIIIAVLLLVLPGFFALMACYDTFRCKRWLFSSYPSPPALQTASWNKNVYQLEDAVFAHLNQRKRPERAGDYWAQAIVLVALTATTISSFLIQPVDIIGSASLAVCALVWAGFLMQAFQRRRSEER